MVHFPLKDGSQVEVALMNPCCNECMNTGWKHGSDDSCGPVKREQYTLLQKRLLALAGDHLSAFMHPCLYPETNTHTGTNTLFHANTAGVWTKPDAGFQANQHPLLRTSLAVTHALTNKHTHARCHTSSPAAAVVFGWARVIDFCVCCRLFSIQLSEVSQAICS